MRTPVPERLLAVADEIGARGSANLTRLTVLKRWFEAPGRLRPFGRWVARRAASRSGRSQGAARELLNEARRLLREAPTGAMSSALPIEAAECLLGRLRAFQSEYRAQRWGRVRVITSWPLLLVEQGLALALDPAPDAADGYRLAADYCRHNDPKFGEALSGPSQGRIRELVRWMFTQEALEDLES